MVSPRRSSKARLASAVEAHADARWEDASLILDGLQDCDAADAERRYAIQHDADALRRVLKALEGNLDDGFTHSADAEKISVRYRVEPATAATTIAVRVADIPAEAAVAVPLLYFRGAEIP